MDTRLPKATAPGLSFNGDRGRSIKLTAPRASCAAFDDRSVADLSSTVPLVSDADSSILPTGDARADEIHAGLADAGELQEDGALHGAMLKMQHDGGVRDVDADFPRTVTAGTYVFSRDRAHGNPDRATFELLLQQRPAANMNLMTTYPLDGIDVEREREHAEEQRKRIAKAKLGGPDLNDAIDTIGTLSGCRRPARIVASDGSQRE